MRHMALFPFGGSKEEQAIIEAFWNTSLTTLYGGYHIEAFE
jgi:hypothetical protein